MYVILVKRSSLFSLHPASEKEVPEHSRPHTVIDFKGNGHSTDTLVCKATS